MKNGGSEKFSRKQQVVKLKFTEENILFFIIIQSEKKIKIKDS